MDSLSGVAPIVGVVALAAAVLHENSRKNWLAVAAAAVAVGSVQYFFPPAPKAVEKKDDEVAAANAKVEAEAAAKAEAAKKAAEYAAAEKALYEQDGPAAEEVAAPAAPAATAVAEEKVAVVEKEDEDEDEAPVVPAAVKFVVCFDFDKCLMSDHWWGRYKNSPIDGIKPTPEDFAHDDIGDLLDRLLNMDGVQVAVASFGRRDVIYKAIASAVGEARADTVYITTPGDFEGYRDGFSMGDQYKCAELEKLCNDIGVKPEQVIFFDDSEPNITHAVDMGVNAHVTAPFNRTHEVHIAAHLGLENL